MGPSGLRDASVAFLAEMGRLIVFDSRGTGLSDGVRGDRLPTLEERIDDLRAVLDAVNSERAIMVAFANGGPLCCLFAATYPGRTKALILNNTGPRTAWAPDYPWGMTPEEFEDGPDGYGDAVGLPRVRGRDRPREHALSGRRTKR